MSKFKHTPGPWEVRGQDVSTKGMNGYICRWSGRSANTRLIAAAPDMLDALIKSYEIVRDLPCECDDYHGTTCGLHKWERDLRGTIEKATGMSIEEVLK